MEDYRELIAIANAETGLSDFGGDSFREGLEILVGSLKRVNQHPKRGPIYFRHSADLGRFRKCELS